jgi:hypothetical protein
MQSDQGPIKPIPTYPIPTTGMYLFKPLFTQVSEPFGEKADLEDIRRIVYGLIEENGTATTLEVKSLLQRQGFEVFEYEVSDAIKFIAREDGLDKVYNGQYLIYSYGGDSNESPYAYLRKGHLYWEAFVEDKKLHCYEGKVNTYENTVCLNHFKNKWAVRHFYELLLKRYEEGYVLMPQDQYPRASYPAA